MAMFYLILIWVALGLFSGALALAARFKPASWGRSGWLWLLALGLLAALCGGLLGFWLLGRLFSPATALWVALLVVCVPRASSALRRRRALP